MSDFNFTEQIQDLEKRLTGLDTQLDITEQEIDKLQEQSQLDKAQIKNKEKELVE